MQISEDKIFSISEFISLLNIGLKTSKAKIAGEVSEVKIGPTGHVYFTLKDEKDGAVLNCIIWKWRYLMYGIRLEEGMKIMAFGNPEIYAPNGRLSFIAETVELAGEGELKKQYEQLKKKLQEEGLFEESRKRALPDYPQKIGVITSLQGAVIADFCNNLDKFGFKIKMIDSRVEGQLAVSDLLSALNVFKKQDIEALVIMRGGGSLESMMAFNNELLVREVANFPIPVVAAIGHDKDTPLITLAADYAPSTPTAAANLLNESWNRALLYLERHEREILDRYQEILINYREVKNKLIMSLFNFKNDLQNIRINLENSLKEYFFAFVGLLTKAKQSLEYATKNINLNNPEHQLKLGYSIAMLGEKIIRKIEDVEIGNILNIKVSNGKISSQIKNKYA